MISFEEKQAKLFSFADKYFKVFKLYDWGLKFCVQREFLNKYWITAPPNFGFAGVTRLEDKDIYLTDFLDDKNYIHWLDTFIHETAHAIDNNDNDHHGIKWQSLYVDMGGPVRLSYYDPVIINVHYSRIKTFQEAEQYFLDKAFEVAKDLGKYRP